MPAEWRVLSEPEWDRVAVNRLAGRKQHLESLGSHGQPMSEAMSPDADPSREGGYQYVVEGPVVDYAARALEAAEKAFYEKAANKDRPRSGDRWRVTKQQKG